MNPCIARASLVIVATVFLVNIGLRRVNDAFGLPYPEVGSSLIETGIVIAILAAFWNFDRQIRADARQAEDRETTSEYREQRLDNDIRIIDALRRIEANRP